MTKRLLMAVGMSFALALVMAATVHGAPAEGRWKLGADGCTFDPNDEGPDQCTRGRWRADGYGGCYFDELDSGPDQCAPSATYNRVTVPVVEPGVRTDSVPAQSATHVAHDPLASRTRTDTPAPVARRPQT